MSRRAVLVFLTIVVFLLPAAGASCGEVTIAPFVGFQYGGALDSPVSGPASIGVGLQYGATLDVAIGGEGWGAEALFARQESDLASVPRIGLAVERYLAGVTEEKGERVRVRGVFLIGVTRFALHGFGSDALFTAALGLGARTSLSSRWGLRADARGYYAVVTAGARTACVNGSCLYAFASSGIWQGDVTAALEFRF